MNIVVDNIEQFKVFFDVVYDMSSELLELQLFPERLVCAVLDRTKTRFFHVEYDVDFFNTYDVQEFQSVVVFIEDIHKLLKSANKTDTLMLEVNDPYLVAKLVSKDGNSRLFEFVLPTDFIDSPTPPHADLPCEFEVDVGALKQGAKDIGLIGSDLFVFVANGDKLNITTDKDIATKYAYEIGIKPLQSSEEAVSAGFNLGYVAQMLKFDKISKKVKLKLGQDYPVFYTFEDDIMGVKVNGLIAPRISED